MDVPKTQETNVSTENENQPNGTPPINPCTSAYLNTKINTAHLLAFSKTVVFQRPQIYTYVL